MPTRATTTRLLLAIVGSLAVHAVVMSSVRLELAAPPEQPPPLEARLEPAPPPPAAPAPAPSPKRKAAAPRQTTVAKPHTVPIRRSETSTPLYVPPEWDVEPVAESEEPSVADAESPTQENTALAAQAPPEAPANPLPRRGQIEYNVLYGSDDGFPVGRIVQSWEIKNGHYVLTSSGETIGLVDFFRPQQMRYISQGQVTSKGLRPDAFFITRTRGSKTETARAEFDWDHGKILYGYARDRKTAALAEGAQDLMSLAYHFSLSPPPPGRVQIPVTTGKDLDMQEIEILPEEVIDTPMGQLRALPLRQIARAGKSYFNLWLAVRYNYLPVRIRYFDREGNRSGEQVAVEIRVGDERELARR